MSQNPVDQLANSMKGLGMSEDFPLPEHWKLNPDEPDALVDRFPADMVKYEREDTKAGAPCHRVVTDENGTLRLQPRLRCHPEIAWFENLKHLVDVEFVTLFRAVPEDERDKPSGDRWIQRGSDDSVLEFITVPEKDVADHEAKGWKVWYPESPAFEFHEGVYMDKRKLRNKPTDVITTDKPAADAALYLAAGNDFVSRHRTKGHWKAGDLFGPNGSTPATKAMSPSYTAPENWDKLTEHRSATSGGHIFHYDRPDNVCLGWGGYDEYTEWQSNGRAVTKDIVDETAEWSTILSNPINLVDEDGNHVEVLEPTIEEKFIPSRPKIPKSLYEAVNEDKKKKLQGHKQHNLRGGRTQDQPAKAKGNWFKPE